MDKTFYKKGMILAVIYCLIVAILFPSINGELLKTKFEIKESLNEGLKSNNTFIVDDEGEGNFTKIQAAIDAASSGDTIIVYSGIYEENIIIDKSLNIVGNSSEFKTGGDNGKPVISWLGVEDIVYINANNINLSGFIVKDNSEYNGILIISNNNKIFNNDIIGNQVGIKLQYIDSNNNNISDNKIYNNTLKGIYIKGSNHNTFYNNYIYNNHDIGLHLESSSSDNTVYMNTIENNTNYGIYISESPNNKILNNTLWRNGIVIFGDDIEHWNTHDIKNNTVNNKPVYYFNNKTSSIVPYDAGQIILANCQYFTIKNVIINNVDIGIQIAFSSFIDINRDGSGCKIFDNLKYGIYISNSFQNNISVNLIESNGEYGIYLYNSYNNVIKNCRIDNNSKIGIFIKDSIDNEIILNFIRNNKEYGVKLDKNSNNNIFYLNKFIDQNYNALSNGSNIWNNDLYGNTWDDFSLNPEYPDSYLIQPYYKPPINRDMKPETNHKPKAPIIYGETRAEEGITYMYSAQSTDPDGDLLTYEWRENKTDFSLTSPGEYDSSEIEYINLSWDEKGIYVLEVRAIDVFGLSSDWASLEISVPKVHTYNPIVNLLIKILEHFPIFEKILNQIIL